MNYDNTNTGLLARNDRKTTDNHPDFTGTINVDGVDYWLSAWTKEGKPGSKLEGRRYFSLSVKAKDAPQQPQQRQQPQRQQAETDSDIPFNSYAPRKASYVV